MEQSLRAFFSPRSAFAQCRAGPEPGIAEIAASLFFWAAAASSFGAAAGLWTNPKLPALDESRVYAAIAAGAAILAAAGALAGAVAHLLGTAVGSAAPLSRGLALAALLAPAAVIAAPASVCAIPGLWLLAPAAVFWPLALGFEELYQAAQPKALACSAVLALGLAGLGFAGGRGLGLTETKKSETGSAAVSTAALKMPGARHSGARPAQAPAAENPAQNEPPRSSVDMVRGSGAVPAPSGEESPQTSQMPGAFPPTGGSTDKTLKSLDHWSKQLEEGSELTKNLTPEQKAQAQALKETLDNVRKQTAQTGVPQDKTQLLLQIMQVVGQARTQKAEKERQEQEDKKPRKKHPKRAVENE
ncbi:MAG: hypothetical protein HY922_00280 [Elusimicrobia bacterium]|nr:hypothetical protein [Elusimicrobiota bacterium]